MSHSLNRTSPKGGRFLGTCTKCGVENIPLARMQEECANPANFTQEEALIHAIKGTTHAD